MKILNKIVLLVLVSLVALSCSKEQEWAENELVMTHVYKITLPTGSSSVAYSIYDQEGYILAWSSELNISSKNMISNFKDLSDGSSLIYTFDETRIEKQLIDDGDDDASNDKYKDIEVVYSVNITLDPTSKSGEYTVKDTENLVVESFYGVSLSEESKNK